MRLSYAKVAEYQQRAAVHVHAVVRLDGAAGPDAPPPNWLDAGTLTDAIHTDEISAAPVTPHLRPLMATCWRLGSLPELEPLHLRAWAHTLGYRGHILTKSRAYSTTYTALREERAAHSLGGTPAAAVTDARWRYRGSGHTHGAALLAIGIAEDLAANHEAARGEWSSTGGGWA